jgi:hypothetical protein
MHRAERHHRTACPNLEAESGASDDSDGVVLTAQYSIKVVVTEEVLHGHAVDLIVAHEEAGVLTVLVDVEDVLTGGPDLSLLDEDMVD